MSFNFIYNPLTNEKYSIFSYEGKHLLKKYIKDYQTGGSGSGEPKNMSDWIIQGDRKANKRKIEECEKAHEECEKAHEGCEKGLAEKDQEIEELKSKLQTMETQPERAKSVEQKVNDEGDEPTPTNPYDFSIEGENENFFNMGGIEVKLDDANKLGRGGSKIVYKIEHGEETFALAKIPSEKIGLGPGGVVEDKKVNDIFKNEIKCLEKLNHPNIAKLYRYVPGEKFHFMLMEYGESNLTEMRGHALTNVELTHKFIINMASAISHLKKKNINHRDIKLENFIIVGESPNQVVKLIDFGISTRCPGTDGYSKEGNPMDVGKPDGLQKMFSSGRGTTFYVAPENATGEPSANTHPGDVFAFGLCILELFYAGRMSYKGLALLNMGSVEKRIKKNFPDIVDLEEFYTTINQSVFNEKSIIQGLLEQNPKKRIEIKEVLEALGVSEVDETEGDGGGK
jgi:hypothetical protein